MIAQTIVDEAKRLLQDIAGDRWSESQLAKLLHFGRLDLLELRPSLYAARTTLTLVQGSEQAITGRRFLYPVCNVVSGVEGKPVTTTDRDYLDAVSPGWRLRTPVSYVQHTIFDEDRPTEFEVYPPVKAGTQIKVSQAVEPTEITNLSQSLSEGPLAVHLTHYIVFRALSEDVEIPQSNQLSQMHYGLYLQGIGAAKRATYVNSPNFRDGGGKPAAEMRNGES